MISEIRIILEPGKHPVVDTYSGGRLVCHDEQSVSVEQALTIAMKVVNDAVHKPV